MKRNLVKSLVLTILVISLFSSCAIKLMGTSKYKVGILLPDGIVSVANDAAKRCEELSNQIDYKIYTASNKEMMKEQLDDLLLWGVDLIVIFPNWIEMKIPIQKAIDEGVVVVNFDISIDIDGCYKVTVDNKDIGAKEAHYIINKVGDNSTILILENPTSKSATKLRKQSFLETINTIAPKTTILTYKTTYTKEGRLKDMTDLLQSNKHIDAIYSMDNETIIGVIQAIENTNRKDIKVISGTLNYKEFINITPLENNLYIPITLYPSTIVRDAIDMGISVLNKEEVPTIKIIQARIVDRTNYKDYLEENSKY